MFGGQFKGKRVWVSGHTGFKGSWLAAWLGELGAQVYGFALEPATIPSAFEQLGLASKLHHEIGDIRDLGAVKESIRTASPDYLFHLAAQPLVRQSYAEPIETYNTNVMGTAHVLETLRDAGKQCVAMFVTTDKCYRNLEEAYAYREDDPLGGNDPYSSSKAAAELVIAAYRDSFFGASPDRTRIASARAGNVVGGGDWSLDRIIPDAVRALRRNVPIPVRNKSSTRPWQHVLEPLSGYLWLAAVMQAPELRGQKTSTPFCSAFNFGPRKESNRTVRELVEELLKHWPGDWIDQPDPNGPHEATLLNLAIEKAYDVLGWEPVWSFEQCIAATAEWYREVGRGADPIKLTIDQIKSYSARAHQLGVAWALDRD